MNEHFPIGVATGYSTCTTLGFASRKSKIDIRAFKQATSHPATSDQLI